MLAVVPGREQAGAHLIDLLVQNPLFEALEHTAELCPEEHSNDDGHHWECNLPEQDIGSSVDGPHEVEVHTLGDVTS